MKKSFVLFIVTIVLAVVIIVYGHTSIFAQKDQVQITEHVLFGDKSLVEGVTLQMKANYEGQLFWDTTYVLGEEPKVDTDYTFYQTRQYPYLLVLDGYIYFNEDSLYELQWMEENSTEELEGLELAVQDLYNVLGPSEYGEKTIFLKDYQDYYHFAVEIQNAYDRETTDTIVFYNMEERALKNEIAEGRAQGHDVKKLGQQLEWLETFQEYFKIPVLENEINYIAMEKDEIGNVTGFALSNVSGGYRTGEIDIPEPPYMEQYDAFRFDTRYSVLDGDVYFTFNTHTFNGEIVDTSLIPGGYGIYHFPYNAEKEEIYPEQLQMVYALDTNIEVCEMTKDASGEHLLLFTLEDDAMYMSVIDIATMILENKIIISDLGEDGTIYGLDYYVLYEDYMVICTYGELVLITIDENGTYKKEFYLSNEEFEILQVDENTGIPIPSSHIVYDWNGEKLVFANYLFHPNGYLGMSFCVAVAGADGLEYFATYDSSLCPIISRDSDDYAYYNYAHCCPVDDGGIAVQWE